MKIRKVTQRAAIMAVVFSMALGTFSFQAMADKDDEWLRKTAEQIAAANNTEVVKTIAWKAKVRAKIKTTNTSTGEKVKVPAGTKVTVIQRDYHEKKGKSECQLKDGTVCYIPTKYLYFYGSKATGKKGDYSEETKLAYINGQTITSPTDTLIWICLDKQRVNVFKGKNKNWELVEVFKCSTGKADTPTWDVSFKAKNKKQRKYYVQKKDKVVNGLMYYTFFYGSGMHKWPGGGMSSAIGIKPMSHSCVRMAKKAAKWIFSNENVPIKSRVWIW